MKVLVTGQKSYAGTQFAKRVLEMHEGWTIDFVSVRDNAWKIADFSIYDTVYHVAGIVHKKETAENKGIYYKVNRDLTYELALKAKNEGVKSFIFLSTMAVYGLVGEIGKDTIISKETKAAATSHYGKSKLEAEGFLETLQSKKFNVSILRIPMIYGPDCPGNYRSLSKLARKTPVFPKINNRRSMIYVDHLSDIVVNIMEEKLSGVLLVKNSEDVDTLELVNEIAKNNNKRIYFSNSLGYIVKLLGNNFSITKKVFGNIVYKNEDCTLLNLEEDIFSFKGSISHSENRAKI